MSKTANVLAFGVFGIITTEFGIIGIMPAIAEHYQISIDTAGSLVSLFALAVAVSGPFMAVSMSRFDRKKIVLWAILAFILSNVLSAVSESFEFLLFARVLPAFLLPVYFSSGLVIALHSVEKKRAMRAVATVYSGLSIATVVGIPITTYIADIFSWKASFWTVAAFNSLAFAGVYHYVPSMPVDKKLSYGAQLGILKKKMLWRNISISCLMAAGAFSVYSYFADYLHTVFYMDGSKISMMLLVFGIMGVLGNWSAGIALSKSIYQTIWLYIMAMGIIFLLLPYTGSNFLLQSALIGAWGFFHMAGFVISQVWINSSAQEAPEFASSLVVSVGNLGIALGTAMGGIIITYFGIHQVVWGGVAAFCLSGLLLMINVTCKSASV